MMLAGFGAVGCRKGGGFEFGHSGLRLSHKPRQEAQLA